MIIWLTCGKLVNLNYIIFIWPAYLDTDKGLISTIFNRLLAV